MHLKRKKSKKKRDGKTKKKYVGQHRLLTSKDVWDKEWDELLKGVTGE